MRALTLVFLAALSSVGCDKLKSTGTVGAGATCAVAGDNLKVDRVKSEGGPIGTDGSNDGAISFTVDGKVSGVVLLTVDEKGDPSDGQQWDTYEEGQAIPAGIKDAPYKDGGPTWQLGVWEGGKSKNASNGTLTPLGDGPHQLTLYASDSGYFKKGQRFIVYAERSDKSLVKSNVFSF